MRPKSQICGVEKRICWFKLPTQSTWEFGECPANEHMNLLLPTKHDLLAAFGRSGEFLTKTWLALRCLINSKLCLKMALRLGGSVCDSNESDQRLHLDGKGNDTTWSLTNSICDSWSIWKCVFGWLLVLKLCWQQKQLEHINHEHSISTTHTNKDISTSLHFSIVTNQTCLNDAQNTRRTKHTQQWITIIFFHFNPQVNKMTHVELIITNHATKITNLWCGKENLLV